MLNSDPGSAGSSPPPPPSITPSSVGVSASEQDILPIYNKYGYHEDTDEDIENPKKRTIHIFDGGATSFSIDEIKRAELSDLKKHVRKQIEQFKSQGSASDSASNLTGLNSSQCSLKTVFFKSDDVNQKSLGFALTDKQKEYLKSAGKNDAELENIRVSNTLTFVENMKKADGNSNPLFKVRTFYLSEQGMKDYEELYAKIKDKIDVESGATKITQEWLEEISKSLETNILDEGKFTKKDNFLNENVQAILTSSPPIQDDNGIETSDATHQILQRFIGKGLLKIPSAEVVRENQIFNSTKGIFKPSDKEKDNGAVINTYDFTGVINLARDGHKIDKFEIANNNVKCKGIYSADAKTEIRSTTSEKFNSFKKYLKPNFFLKTNYQFWHYDLSSDKNQAILQEYNPNAPFNALLKKTHEVTFEIIGEDKLKKTRNNNSLETDPSRRIAEKDINSNSDIMNKIMNIVTKKFLLAPFVSIKETFSPNNTVKVLYTKNDTKNTLVGQSSNTSSYGFDYNQYKTDDTNTKRRYLAPIGMAFSKIGFVLPAKIASSLPVISSFTRNSRYKISMATDIKLVDLQIPNSGRNQDQAGDGASIQTQAGAGLGGSARSESPQAEAGAGTGLGGSPGSGDKAAELAQELKELQVQLEAAKEEVAAAEAAKKQELKELQVQLEAAKEEANEAQDSLWLTSTHGMSVDENAPYITGGFAPTGSVRKAVLKIENLSSRIPSNNSSRNNSTRTK